MIFNQGNGYSYFISFSLLSNAKQSETNRRLSARVVNVTKIRTLSAIYSTKRTILLTFQSCFCWIFYIEGSHLLYIRKTGAQSSISFAVRLKAKKDWQNSYRYDFHSKKRVYWLLQMSVSTSLTQFHALTCTKYRLPAHAVFCSLKISNRLFLPSVPSKNEFNLAFTLFLGEK